MFKSLPQLIPDPKNLVELQPEELAGYVLCAINLDLKSQPSEGPHRRGYEGELFQGPIPGYPDQMKREIVEAINEAMHWLITHGYLLPRPDTNGDSGWLTVSRKARTLKSVEEFKDAKHSAMFPTELLHPLIAKTAWRDFTRGRYETAVFEAFKAVEIAVRSAGGFTDADYGVAMIRKAFDPAGGPLASKMDLPAEREALSALAAGALGSYKNPHSHRSKPINEPGEAIEMIMLASHLLRIVDARASTRKGSE